MVPGQFIGEGRLPTIQQKGRNKLYLTKHFVHAFYFPVIELLVQVPHFLC